MNVFDRLNFEKKIAYFQNRSAAHVKREKACITYARILAHLENDIPKNKKAKASIKLSILLQKKFNEKKNHYLQIKLLFGFNKHNNISDFNC